MAWACISKIKNSLNEYQFTTFPLVGYNGHVGGSYTTLSFGGERGYGSPSTQYLEGIAVINNLLGQTADKRGKFSYSDSNFTNFNKNIYGDAGGSGLKISDSITLSSYSDPYLLTLQRIINFSTNNILSQAGSYANNDETTVESDFHAFGLVVNSDLEQLYVALIWANKAYYNGPDNPHHYDSATVKVYIYDVSSANLWAAFKNSIPSGGGGSDPYAAGGYSDTTPSSSGDFDDDSDSISVPSLPSISALGAGAVSLAVISEAELKNFMDYIMNPSFTGLSSISRFFSDPIQAIACLNYMPYTPTNTSGFTLSWGGDDTGASVGAVSAQYEEIDCGSVNLSEYYGSCLDYSPYTTVQLVLPFAGSVDIDPDEFNGKTISVKYHLDNYTGAGLALVSDGDRVLLQVPCSVSNPVPLTSADYSAIIASIANVVMGGVSTIAAVYTGGASVGASVALAGGFAASAAGNVMSAKLHFNHGGSMGMGTGMFGVLKPYLIIKRPRQCLPEQNGTFQGYPTFVTENLGDLSGFTKIAEIHLDSIPVTTAERAELLAILKGGVIF